ncbi:MAG: hypothetical protein LBI05_08715 [Planctomycetaceae bacterium]|jgi:hypothetical protein|nr:hypothetical protein [Planctomycetaceae bacterium]
MTTFPFHTTVLDNGMLAVPLPEEFRGAPVSVVVEEKPAMFKLSSTHETGILSIAGILKDCRNENIHDERYEDLIEKYADKDFRCKKTLDEIIAEQGGPRVCTNPENLGKDMPQLWDTEAELEEFLERRKY